MRDVRKRIRHYVYNNNNNNNKYIYARRRLGLRFYFRGAVLSPFRRAARHPVTSSIPVSYIL